MNHIAQKIGNPYLNNSVQNLSGTDFLGRLISLIVNVGFVIGSIAFVIMLVWGGVQWITSGGDKAQLESSRARIGQAIIGLFVLFIVFVIIKTMETLFNISILSIDISRFSIAN